MEPVKSTYAPRGMVVTPHHLATHSALKILQDGGTAMEAMVAAAATISVVYPHMNSIGGDGFWLIVPPKGDYVAIEACGAAGSLVNDDFFEGYGRIPLSGPKSALTVAGTIGGWEEALKYATECEHKTQPLCVLLADAIHYAENGFPTSLSQVNALKDIEFEDKKYDYQAFKDLFLPKGQIPKEGELFKQPNLAKTLKALSKDGLRSFYVGDLAKSIANEVASYSMPITKSDFKNYTPIRRIPLKISHSEGEIINLPPPTQGVLSLSILGMLDDLKINGKHEGQFIHATVEATKQAFLLRDEYITDPKYMKVKAESLITKEAIAKMAKNIDLNHASAVGKSEGPADTIWMGIMDSKGYSVSFIQSIFRYFGSKVLLPKTGILWHNRGIAFNLIKDDIKYLVPGKKPFHTLNPAAAKLNDGRLMVYGTMGGDGQPQTQAAIFHRYVVQQMNLQKSVSDPRWVYGGPLPSVYGMQKNLLQLEKRFSPEIIEYLKKLGHNIELLDEWSEDVGQAGALVRHPTGILEGAYDPRSDGNAAGY